MKIYFLFKKIRLFRFQKSFLFYILIFLFFYTNFPLQSKAAESQKIEESPHVEALKKIFQTEAKKIEEIDHPKEWWFDIKKRAWIVQHPFSSGGFDSTHLFKVEYGVDGKKVGLWPVNMSQKQNLEKEQAAESPHVEALKLLFSKEQKKIEKLDRETRSGDVKKRKWIIKRPVLPGGIDSTHTFGIDFFIDEKKLCSWSVETKQKTIQENCQKIIQ